MKPKRIMKRRKITDALIRYICMRLSSGETLLRVLKDMEKRRGRERTPDRVTLWRAINTNLKYHETYMRSRVEQQFAWAEEIVELADKANDRDSAAAQRLKVHTRWNLMQSTASHVFGKRVKHEHSGPEGGPIVTADATEDKLRELLNGAAERASKALDS